MVFNMGRAHRHFLKGYVWHITQRCHNGAFLLKFAVDRRRWIHWLYTARTRYRLSVLNYIVTCNHIHLLVSDRGDGEIARSMQLIAGRVGQEFNRRKSRSGPFWQDRYHATAVQTDSHLLRCMTYIDLNMVRARVVQEPGQWPDSGLAELIRGRQRYRTIDTQRVNELLGCANTADMLERRTDSIDEAMAGDLVQRESVWTTSIAVGTDAFAREVRAKLGLRARYRTVDRHGSVAYLAEPDLAPYVVEATPKIPANQHK